MSEEEKTETLRMEQTTFEDFFQKYGEDKIALIGDVGLMLLKVEDFYMIFRNRFLVELAGFMEQSKKPKIVLTKGKK